MRRILRICTDWNLQMDTQGLKLSVLLCLDLDFIFKKISVHPYNPSHLWAIGSEKETQDSFKQ